MGHAICKPGGILRATSIQLQDFASRSASMAGDRAGLYGTSGRFGDAEHGPATVA